MSVVASKVHLERQAPSDLSRSPVARWTEFLQQTSISLLAMRRRMGQQIAQLQLNPSQFFLLLTCHHHGDNDPSRGISQRELATELALSAPQISGLVEQLRRRELLVSHRSPDDRRLQLWQATAKGRVLLESASSQLVVWAEGLDRAISIDPYQTVCSVLARLANVADPSNSIEEVPPDLKIVADVKSRPSREISP